MRTYTAYTKCVDSFTMLNLQDLCITHLSWLINEYLVKHTRFKLVFYYLQKCGFTFWMSFKLNNYTVIFPFNIGNQICLWVIYLQIAFCSCQSASNLIFNHTSWKWYKWFYRKIACLDNNISFLHCFQVSNMIWIQEVLNENDLFGISYFNLLK